MACYKRSQIEQPSAQWTLAQPRLHDSLSEEQKEKAVGVLQRNLRTSGGIVLNSTMQTLGGWAREDEALRKWLEPQLVRLSQDDRKSVARKAKKLRTGLTDK